MSKSTEFHPQIKATVPQKHYKYMLDAVAEYHKNKSFDDFWRTLMPMFKFHNEKVHILRALRRFLASGHKSSFDGLMAKHFIVE
jgi:hypothetical protein